VSNQITPPNFPTDIFKLPKLPTQLSGQSNYLTWFATWHLQIANITHPVEWATKLPNPICHLNSPNCQNYPIFITWLRGQSNYPTRFATWHLQIATITNPVEWAIKLPNPISQLTSSNCQNYPMFVTWLSGQWNYPTQFATWILHIATITQFLSPGSVGNQITPPNFPTDIFKLPKFPTLLSGQSDYPTQFATWHLQIANITHPVEWAIKLPNPICHLTSSNCQNYQPGWVGNQISQPDFPTDIFRLPKLPTRLSGQSNYPTRFPNWHLQIAKITNPVEWAIKLPNPISPLTSSDRPN
jgi:hypothetical protein